MRPQTRALMWEEWKNARFPAGCLIFAGLSGMAISYGTFGERPPIFNFFILYYLQLFLLIYGIPHFGLNENEKDARLPNRILLLPIEITHAIASKLFARIGIIAGANALLLLGAHLLFLNSPPWILLLILPTLFLVRQAWNWLYPSPITLSVYTGVLVATVITISAGVSQIPFEKLSNPLVTWLIAALSFAGVAAWTCMASVFAAQCYRCSRYPTLPFHGPQRLRIQATECTQPISFRSPRTANLWACLRQQGLSLPTGTLGVAALGILLYFVYDYTVGFEAPPPNRLPGEIDLLNLTLFRVWGPWYVLQFAALITGILNGSGAFETTRMDKSAERFMPISTGSITMTRMFSNGLSLTITWFIVTLVAGGTFLLSDSGLGWRLYSEAWQAGEVSAREIARAELGFPLLMLLTAWILLAIRTRLVACTAGLALLPVVAHAISQARFYNVGKESFQFFLSRQLDLSTSLAFALSLVSIVPFAALAWILWRNLARPRHVLCCALVWLLVALCVYPYRLWPVGTPDLYTIAMAIAAGALAILPYPALLLDIHKSRHNSDSYLAKREQVLPCKWNLQPGTRFLLVTLPVFLILISCWLTWPARPAYVKRFRDLGKPVALIDVTARAKMPPSDDNNAVSYVNLLEQVGKSAKKYYRPWPDQPMTGQDLDTPRRMYAPTTGLPDYLRRGPISTTVWDAAQAQEKQIAQPIISAIQSAVTNGKIDGPVTRLLDYTLTEGSMIQVRGIPANYFTREFPFTTMDDEWHVASQTYEMERLANALALDIWIASVESRQADIFGTLECIGVVARTLRDEPTIASQISYLHLYASSVQALEFCMNRVAFSREELDCLVRWSNEFLPEGAARKAIELAVEHECTFELDQELRAARAGEPLSGPSAYFESWTGGFYRVAKLRVYAEIENDPETINSTPIWTEMAESVLPRFMRATYSNIGAAQYDDALRSTEVHAALLKTACALEAYRLSKGKVPERLDQLVPEFIDHVEADAYRPGEGLSYRIRDDGEYVLYSLGPNREDDWNHDDMSDDLTYAVVPSSLRIETDFVDSKPTKGDDA